MSLKQSIRRILIEESSLIGKINLMVKKFGFLNAVKAIGGYSKFKKIYGKELTKEKKIEFIKDIVKHKSTDEGVLDLFDFDIYIALSSDMDIRDIYDNGSYLYRVYGWDPNNEEWDMENYDEGYGKLIDLDESRIDSIIISLVNRIK